MSAKAPEFRPRGVKSRGRRFRFLRRRYIVAGGAALAVILAGVITTIVVLNSGGGGSSSAGGSNDDRSVSLDAPASRYVVQVSELPKGFSVFSPDTYDVSSDALGSSSGAFQSAQEGPQQLQSWGYVDGYQASFQPDGLMAGVVQGGYYVLADVYLFKTPGGAHDLYTAFTNQYRTASGSVEIKNVGGVGNESSAWQIVQGQIGTSSMIGVFHRIVFRRGNAVVTVQTFGGQPFMDISKARDVAKIIDDKTLGTRPAPTPTPNITATPAVVGG